MSIQSSVKLLVSVAVLIVAIGGSYWLGHRAQKNDQKAMAPSQSSEQRVVLYWYDPMNPAQHFDKPGKSPFMDMQLVPKYQEDTASISIDSSITQQLGIRVVKVERSIIHSTWNASGVVAFNQSAVAIVQARTNGFVARVFQHAPGDVLKLNDPLVDVLVPEWAGAQAEYLALAKSSEEQLISAARSRLVLMGMSEQLIADIEHTQHIRNTITIRAPRAGVITSLEVREGMTIVAGNTLATINGLETMWLEVAVPESQAALLDKRQNLSAKFIAYPGETFSGKVVTILPDTNAESHTLRARIELKNNTRKLKAGMFAQVQLSDDNNKPVLNVPAEAVIRTGTRNVVLVFDEGRRYTPVEVTTVVEDNSRITILSGVTEGQSIVASGQFLIDSEANLSGVLNRMNAVETKSNGSDGSPGSAP